jgi:hypothetical protein
MHAEPVPALSDRIVPPIVLGTAALSHAAMAGAKLPALLTMIEAAAPHPAARAYDTALAYQLAFRRAEGLDLLDDTLGAIRMFRVGGSPAASRKPLRLLALCTPGDLMVNTPLDFITNHLDIRLDLLFILPGEPLPHAIPDHDIAFVASSQPDADTLLRLINLFAIWPRPILNDPGLLPRLARDALPAALRGVRGVCCPPCAALDRGRLDVHLQALAPLIALPPRHPGPLLIRPQNSHAGTGLRRIENNAQLRDYLMFSFARHFFVTGFVDYRSSDGLFRKYRIAFIEGVPHLCHMAVSQNWMIHYLNAGMTESEAKRADEAAAMADFETGFAARHHAAFAALQSLIGFDLWSIDCAETPDGRLLIFEADTAAIIHLMDPPDLFPYKHPHMRRVFAAFEAMLRRRISRYAAAGESAFAM